MSTAIAIFVKTPTLSPFKTRLAAAIGAKNAQKFYHLSLDAVRETVQDSDASPHWAVAEKHGLGDPLWQDFPRLHTGDGNLGKRQHHVYESLLATHQQVLLIGADAPQLSVELIHSAINELQVHDFVVGPARDGGYYLFGGKRSTPQSIWTSVPWSTSVTREALEGQLPTTPVHLPMLTDVDTEDDLKFIGNEMPALRNHSQRVLLEWIATLS